MRLKVDLMALVEGAVTSRSRDDRDRQPDAYGSVAAILSTQEHRHAPPARHERSWRKT
jgi:hypothetical protein